MLAQEYYTVEIVANVIVHLLSVAHYHILLHLMAIALPLDN